MSAATFAVCIQNTGYEAALQMRKIYQVLEDSEASRYARVRVIDESGEVYLFPADFFTPIQLPESLVLRFLQAA